MAAAEVSPEDLLETAVAENKAALEGELLKRALALHPRGFELLVLRLLAAMGYGKSGAVEHSGQSGDGGIDGIITVSACKPRPASPCTTWTRTSSRTVTLTAPK